MAVQRGNMSITTCQKVTLISCSVLCVSLFLPRMFLPRAKQEMGQPHVGPGFHPPGMHQVLSDDPEQWAVDPLHALTYSMEASARIKGTGRGKKYNLMAQVIPIYGFGILLYILYIIYKLTCKGKSAKSGKYSMTTVGRNITHHEEFARLQERLRQTERMMERIVAGNSHASGRRRKSKATPTKKEEKLLRQLREITQLMQEGRVEGASPEMEAEEVPYGADWEGYPEETYPEYHVPDYKYEMNSVATELRTNQPTAEALAERMEQEEEEIVARKLSIVHEEDEEDEDEDLEDVEDDTEKEEEEEEEEEEEAEAEKRLLLSPHVCQADSDPKQERLGLEVSNQLQCLDAGKKHISFNDHKDVFHYPKEDTYEEEEEVEKEEDVDEEDDGTEVEEEEEEDEEDPVTEAESLQFSSAGCTNPEEEAEEELAEGLFTLVSVGSQMNVHIDSLKEVSGLRMRNRRET
uniref:protein RIC-3 n=1 Tax=Doryrhamphus excisus TaxID=161450 RepID=UPI0025ADF318|nr:protein RIC-3 [Doryrhamphus excisus]